MAYKESDQDKDELNDPQAGQGAMRNKKIRVFHSFKEAEAAESLDEAIKDPMQRIRETVQLILRAYGVTQEDLNKRKRSNKITIIRYE